MKKVVHCNLSNGVTCLHADASFMSKSAPKPKKSSDVSEKKHKIHPKSTLGIFSENCQQKNLTNSGRQRRSHAKFQQNRTVRFRDRE